MVLYKTDETALVQSLQKLQQAANVRQGRGKSFGYRLSFFVLTYAFRHHRALISTSGNTVHVECAMLNSTDIKSENFVLWVTSQLCTVAEFCN